MIPVATADPSRGHSATAAAAPATRTNLRGVLIAAVVLVLLGLVLVLDVAAVVPWQSLQVAAKLRGAPSSVQGQGNHSSSPATYHQAQELQQQHHQQQQEHQQQQHLLEVRQQHEQQAQALSTLQQAQQQVQAGVQKLEQHYEHLSKSLAAATTRNSSSATPGSATPGPAQQQQQQQQQHGNVTAQGVVCTVLRNEARYIPEWVAFHLIMGATKVVIYDDNSTDGIQEAAAPFGERLVIVDMKGVQGVPGDTSVHRMNARQNWAFNHCKATHAPPNGTGWLGIWDVDEFVFPCMRSSLQLQGMNLIWDAYNASTEAGADGHALHCSLFGQNHNDTPQGNDALVLVNNIRRAPDSRSEPAAAPKAWEAVAEGCNKCGCCQVTSRKTIYNLNMFKSTEEARAKATANLNDHYTKVVNTTDSKKHLTMLVDTLIWQYLPDMVQMLQQKGFHYKLPDIPMLVARE
ncbi:hypothetical protein OEZ85_003278 [Tetradesmus obliquus]|uniref:Glycosyltransferase family 92 protein n=1 Tax=Tetradesmus obliquus TaxID=3088 RepID=A0ABY8U120_TETOB|nr:hypothetical protein OEZ85_003278 [Tetradesmus obliquus]